MKKLTAVPVQLKDNGCRCFCGPTNTAFIELDCDEAGKPLVTDENSKRIQEVVEHYNKQS